MDIEQIQSIDGFDKLSSKQQKFAAHYAVHSNATQAALHADYSEKTAYSQGQRLLKNVEIQKVIQEIFRRNTMSEFEVLHRLTEIARGDLSDVVDDYGNLDMAKAKSKGKTKLLKKVKSRSITTDDSDIHEAEVETYDALKALELLARKHDLINKIRVERVEDRVIVDIRAGRIDFEPLAQEFGLDLATQLFQQAGVPIDTDANVDVDAT